jgi:hypothetical protein
MSNAYKVTIVPPPPDITFPTIVPVAPLLPTLDFYSYTAGGSYLANTFKTIGTNVPEGVYRVQWTGSYKYRTSFDSIYLNTGLGTKYLNVSSDYGVVGEHAGINGEMLYRLKGTVQVRSYLASTCIFFCISITRVGD